jgi:tetratricopeptide (TPR) repeat protein
VLSTLVKSFRGALLLSIFIAPFAHASSRADELLSQGVELRRQGNDAAALERFREAFRLAPTPRAVAQMGLAEQALGFWTIAGQHVGRALEAKEDPWIRKYQAALEQALTVINSHLEQLHITGTPDGAEVLVDGQSVGTLPLTQPLQVSQGTIVVEVRAKGYVAISRPVQIAPGIQGREHFALQPGRSLDATTAAPTQPAETPVPTTPGIQTERAGRTLRIVAWTSAAAAAGALGLGIYSQLALRDRKQDYDNGNCAVVTSPRCDTLAERGKKAQTVMFVSYGLAAALTATSIISFANDKPSRDGVLALTCVPTLVAPGATCAFRF